MIRVHRLLELLLEEIEMLRDDDDDDNDTLLRIMESAHRKLSRGDFHLSRSEQAAVSYALEDTGKLYELAGTCAGFDEDYFWDDPKMDVLKARRFGRGGAFEAMRVGASSQMLQPVEEVAKRGDPREVAETFDDFDDAVDFMRIHRAGDYR